MWIEIERSSSPPRLVGEPEESAAYEYKRDFIGGPITYVSLGTFTGRDGRRYSIDLWFHDEGLSLDLPQSVIVPGLYPDRSGIRGPAIIDMADEDGRSIPLSPEALGRIRFVEGIRSFPSLPIVHVIGSKD